MTKLKRKKFQVLYGLTIHKANFEYSIDPQYLAQILCDILGVDIMSKWKTRKMQAKEVVEILMDKYHIYEITLHAIYQSCSIDKYLIRENKGLNGWIVVKIPMSVEPLEDFEYRSIGSRLAEERDYYDKHGYKGQLLNLILQAGRAFSSYFARKFKMKRR